jgi:hypothetical protein
MMHTSTSARLKEEFMKNYSKDVKITGGDLMNFFLGMQVGAGRPRDALRV